MARRFADRFELIERAGEGGMGEVWKALDHETGSLVALKRLRGTGREQARFEREARLLEQVRHPALVAHVAHGIDDGRPYLAMSWIEGESLAARLARAPLSLGDTLQLARRVASALAALHAVGAVHRDVKPANVMLPHGRAQDAVLLDLGIARERDAPLVTATNLILGTIGYLSPEQARSEQHVDARADVFSLGCVLFECASGEPLYAADNAIAMLARMLAETPRRLRSVRPEVPEPLDDLVASMLASAPDDRPAGGVAVLRALDEIGPLDAAVATSQPRARPALSRNEQRFSLAAWVELASPTPLREGVTLDEVALDVTLRDTASRLRELGADLVPIGPTSALVVVEPRGTVADQAELAASVLCDLLTSRPSLRAAMAAGLATTSAGVPAGEVLARATRLARGTSAGTIALDDTLVELLGARFEVAGHVLGRARERAEATPFIGRDKELATMEAMLAEVIDEGAPRGVLVTAAPGVGKSRLGRELSTRLRARGDVRVIEASAEVTSARSVNATTRALVRAAAGLPPHAPGARVDPRDGDRLRGYLRSLPLDDAERVADLLCDLIGAPPRAPGIVLAAARGDAELTSRWTRRSVREWLAAECARAPVVLVIEDLHWADEVTLGHLGDALRARPPCPLLVVALARPEVRDHLRTPWPHTTHLTLSELGARASERLVRAALGLETSNETISRIVERAGGNPLFLEELSRFVRERRAAADPSAPKRRTLPPTVAAVLHARLDDLPADRRRVLRAASVLGDRFLAEGVAAITGESVTIVERTLHAIASRGMVERTDEGWAFSHALVREAAYATMSPDDAPTAHARAADWLEGRGDPDPREMLAHVERAKDAEREAQWLLRATARAWDAGADRETFELAARGLARATTDEERGAYEAWTAVSCLWRGELERGLEHARRAVSIVPLSHPIASLAVGSAVYLAGVSGDLQTVALITQAWIAQGAVPSGRQGGIALVGILIALDHAGATDVARGVLERAMASERAHPVWTLLARSAMAHSLDGQLGASRALALEAIELATRQGDDTAVIFGHGYAIPFVGACRSREALAALDALHEAQAHTAMPIALAWIDLWRASVRQLVDGHAPELEAHARQHDLSRAEAARYLLILGHVLGDRLDAAEAEIARAPFVTARFRPTAMEARIALRRGAPETALARLDDAAREASAVTSVWSWEWIHLTRAEALLAMGRDDEARIAARTGLERLAITLEGADPWMREIVDASCVPVIALREIAARLGG
ncbi:serine/threonine-protein kinase [Sandaracinus amylolyticus]|uniref:Adenylate cyclase n=1 Tax=Sandaracinus amylolyticus TaxID=927083 RepID=A0A0F6VZR6_9BACT|nr:serine/threonine-protein kinase [Sandaracinus amylolyticus]AKF03583.1 Adenylate cyclase [Sandaracinus amylolyticus]